jgi:CRP-like cAMP-binding protein
MKTQTTQAQPNPDMRGLKNILVPLDFSPASDNAAKKERMMEPTVESLETRVALHPFLVGMKPRQLALLTSCAVAIEFKKGQVLCREGEVADRFYLIESGRVVLESNGVLDDPMLGCSWIFPSHAWTFTARAAEPTTVIFFSATILREYCEMDHSLGYELLKRMSLLMYGRMQAARNKMPAIHHRSETFRPGGAVAVYGADTPDPEMKIAQKYPGENADRECGQIAG